MLLVHCSQLIQSCVLIVRLVLLLDASRDPGGKSARAEPRQALSYKILCSEWKHHWIAFFSIYGTFVGDLLKDCAAMLGFLVEPLLSK